MESGTLTVTDPPETVTDWLVENQAYVAVKTENKEKIAVIVAPTILSLVLSFLLIFFIEIKMPIAYF